MSFGPFTDSFQNLDKLPYSSTYTSVKVFARCSGAGGNTENFKLVFLTHVMLLSALL